MVYWYQVWTMKDEETLNYSQWKRNKWEWVQNLQGRTETKWWNKGKNDRQETTEKVQMKRLNWDWHVMRMEEARWPKRTNNLTPLGNRKRTTKERVEWTPKSHDWQRAGTRVCKSGRKSHLGRARRRTEVINSTASRWKVTNSYI
jgi:hypothetical protein